MKICISVDGGGIRGIIPARILSWIEEHSGAPISATASLIAGTSTGGILACGLAHTTDGKTPTYTAAQLLGLYADHGAEIFHRPWYEPMALLHVKYPAESVEGVLKQYYGDVKLSASLTDILVTAFDQAKWEPRFFKSRKARASASEDAPLWYTARATSAAPTYFPNIDGLVDGGVMGVTNPSMIALVEARETWPGEDIFLLSIGTGRKDGSVETAQSTEWGELAYLSSLVDMLLDGPEKVVEREVADLLPPDRYIRIQGTLTGSSPSSAMDDASAGNIQALIAFADQIIAQNQDALQRTIQILKAQK